MPKVAALGKEVTRRAEACAEARKLNASLRRQIEVARRTRANNLDTVDVACRRLIAGSVEEAEVLQESWGVAREAERYHEALTRLQVWSQTGSRGELVNYDYIFSVTSTYGFCKHSLTHTHSLIPFGRIPLGRIIASGMDSLG